MRNLGPWAEDEECGRRRERKEGTPEARTGSVRRAWGQGVSSNHLLCESGRSGFRQALWILVHVA